MVVSEAVAGTVTMRLEDVTAMQAVEIIAKSKALFVDKIDGVYYVKTAAERTAEPTESDSYPIQLRPRERHGAVGGGAACRAKTRRK